MVVIGKLSSVRVVGRQPEADRSKAALAVRVQPAGGHREVRPRRWKLEFSGADNCRRAAQKA